MQATYDLSKILGPTYGCDVDLPANVPDSQEKQWAAGKIEVIHVNWADSAAAAPAAAATAQTSSAQSPRFFISCSTEFDTGIDRYFTDVFQTDLKTNPMHGNMPPNNPWIVGRKYLVDPASAQSVLDRFQAYLTQKGYKFSPGKSVHCDIAMTEAEARAAQHKRAYEEGRAGGWGKVVETGWKE